MACQIHQNINRIGADLRNNRGIFQGAHGTPIIEKPAQPRRSGIRALADIVSGQVKSRALMRRIACNAANPRECRGTARARMFCRFQHQKRCHAAQDQPACFAARGNRRVIALPQHATWRIK